MNTIKKTGRKFIIVTEDLRGLGFALLNKTDEVILACNPNAKIKDNPDDWKAYNLVGKGIAKVYWLKDVMNKRNQYKEWYWIFDGNHSVKENEQLRKEGFKVGLGGQLAYNLENDRKFAIETAEKYGIPSPMWENFTKKEAGIEYLKKYPDIDFVFKPNGGENYLTTVLSGTAKENNELLQIMIKNLGIDDFILQERKEGIEVNLEIFFMQGKAMSASINLEIKRILAGDSGKMCGCASDCVKDISLDSKLVKMTMAKMIPFYEKEKYTGFADVNIIIGDRDIWFLENCNRLGINQHINYFMNIEKKDFLNTIADLIDGTYKPEVNKAWGASLTGYAPNQHKGIPINIPEELKDKVFLFDGWKDTDSDVILESGFADDLLVVCDKHYCIEDAMTRVYEHIKKLNIPNLGYRNDSMLDNYPSSPVKRYRQLGELGYL